MSLTFGITGCGTTYGLMQSQDTTYTTAIADAVGCDGKVVTKKAYSVHKEVTVKVLVDGTLPQPGETETINGITGLVSSIVVNEANTAFEQGTVTIVTDDSASHIAY